MVSLARRGLLALSLAVPALGRAQSTDSTRVDTLHAPPEVAPDVVVRHRLDVTLLRGTTADNPVEALAGRIPGARVRYDQTAPGDAPLLEFRHNTMFATDARPLYTFDGIRLLEGVADLPASAIRSMEVTPGLGGTIAHGASAAGGLVEFASARPRAGPMQITAHTELGNSWLPLRYAASRHHHYRLGPDGGYVDASGNPVDAAGRVPDPDQIADNPYPGPLYDHRAALFDRPWRSAADVSIARRHASGWISVGGGHEREGPALRENHDLTRTHARLSIGQQVHRVVQVDATAMRIDGHVPDVAVSNGYLRAATMVGPDFDMRALAPGGWYASPLPMQFGALTNPLLYPHAGQSRERTIAGVHARADVRKWLALDVRVGVDALDLRLARQDPRIDSEGLLREWYRTLDEADQDSWTADVGLDARFRRWGLDWTSGVVATGGRRLLDARSESSVWPVGMNGNPSLVSSSTWSRERTLGRHSWSIAGRHGSGVSFLANLRRERTPWGDDHAWSTDHLIGASADVAHAWRSAPAWLDRAELRLATGTSWRDVPLEIIPFASSEPTAPERARESEVSLDVLMADRHRIMVTASWGTIAHFMSTAFAGAPSAVRNVANIDRHSLEAMFATDLVRRPRMQWSVGLGLDRGHQSVGEVLRPPHVDRGLGLFVHPGARYGQIHGSTWTRSHAELPAVHAGSHAAFAVNDDGLLVPVGIGGSLADPAFGTTVTIDGQSYDWGLPIPNADGAWRLIADRNPELGIGATSTLRWRALAIGVVASGQLGGDVYDHLRQAGYRQRTHADVDQSGKAPGLRKPVAYYQRLYENFPNDWFVRDATHLRLREVSIAITPAFARGLTASLVGRNLATWSSYEGLDVEAPFAAVPGDQSIGPFQDFRIPRLRSLSFQIGYGF